MDRLPRPFVACGLGLLMMAFAGCRSTRPEVPPGRPYAKDGQQRQAISFSSDGHGPAPGASTNFMPNNVGGSNLASGIGQNEPRPNATNFGAPPGSYGPPGTSGMSQPGASSDPAAARAANTAPMEMPPIGMPPGEAPPPAGASPMPNPNVGMPQVDRNLPNQVIQLPKDDPGTMGTPDQPPSPY